MVRMIDAEKYMELLKEQYLHHKSMGNSQAARAWQGAMQLLYDMPTLTPPNDAEKAIQRMGEFGKRFLDYKGCSRGPMGAPGECTIEEWVHTMPVLKDVDGEKWRPVQEAALNALLNSLPPNEWVSVEERLPESQTDVLVVAFWHERWQTMIGWHSDTGKKWRVITPHGEREPGGVTHWMLLPAPPDKDNNVLAKAPNEPLTCKGDENGEQ